jgi:hypothetical protein
VQIKQAFHLTMPCKELHNLPSYPEALLNMMPALYSYTTCITLYAQETPNKGKSR